MKLLLIKIGKAWHTLRREGLVRGGRRVLTAFLALFGRVKPGDILFITGGVGDSARYRCQHVAEELEQHGFRTAVTVQDNPFLASYADRFSIFVFHRVLFTPSVAKLVGRIKEKQKTIIFETDDLVYDKAFLQHMDYFRQMNTFERKLYENGVGGEILADPYVEVCTTSTTYLANKLREKGKRVYIVPNKLSKEDVANVEKILSSCHSDRSGGISRSLGDARDDTVVRVSYLSGTPSHNKDFATITDALATLLEKYPNLRLVLAGPLDTDDRLQHFASQIERLPYVPRREYFGNVARMDINVAPLEIGNPFCESKSELKFFEAGICGVPTVAAATQTFREAIRDGEDGFVASNTEEWRDKIERLIVDADLRKTMGQRARETASEKYTTTSAKNEAYYEYLRSSVNRLKS